MFRIVCVCNEVIGDMAHLNACAEWQAWNKEIDEINRPSIYRERARQRLIQYAAKNNAAHLKRRMQARA